MYFIVKIRILPIIKTQTPMLLTITLIIFSLVVLNLLLLKFSSNKVEKSPIQEKRPVILRTDASVKSLPKMLAPTGS